MTLLFAFSLASLIAVRLVFGIFAAFDNDNRECRPMVFIFPEILVFESVKESHEENIEKIKKQQSMPQTQQTKINIQISAYQCYYQTLEATIESMPQVLCRFVFVCFVLFCLSFFLLRKSAIILCM